MVRQRTPYMDEYSIGNLSGKRMPESHTKQSVHIKPQVVESHLYYHNKCYTRKAQRLTFSLVLYLEVWICNVWHRRPYKTTRYIRTVASSLTNLYPESDTPKNSSYETIWLNDHTPMRTNNAVIRSKLLFGTNMLPAVKICKSYHDHCG